MYRRLANTCPEKRRGGVAVMVCITMPVLLGFAALTIDLGRLFCTRHGCQNAADATVLAAIQDLRGANAMEAMRVARQTAAAYAAKNPVWDGKQVVFDPDTDMVFGVARRSDDGSQVVFTPGIPFNAVEVTVRFELEYTFARIFGAHSRVVAASALAGIKARDVMLVLDHSGSMDDDAIETSVCADLAALGIFVCGGGASSPDDWGNIPPASDDSDSSGGDDSD